MNYSSRTQILQVYFSEIHATNYLPTFLISGNPITWSRTFFPIFSFCSQLQSNEHQCAQRARSREMSTIKQHQTQMHSAVPGTVFQKSQHSAIRTLEDGQLVMEYSTHQYATITMNVTQNCNTQRTTQDNEEMNQEPIEIDDQAATAMALLLPLDLSRELSIDSSAAARALPLILQSQLTLKLDLQEI